MSDSKYKVDKQNSSQAASTGNKVSSQDSLSPTYSMSPPSVASCRQTRNASKRSLDSNSGDHACSEDQKKPKIEHAVQGDDYADTNSTGEGEETYDPQDGEYLDKSPRKSGSQSSRNKTSKSNTKTEMGVANKQNPKPKKQTLTNLRQAGTRLRKQIKEHKTSEKDLKQNLKESREEVLSLKDALLKLQRGMINQHRKNQRKYMDDNEIRTKINLASDSWDKWARKWCGHEDLTSCIEKEGMQTMFELLEGQSSNYLSCSLMLSSATPRLANLSGAQRLILHALLSHYVCKHIVSEPFFFLSNQRYDEHSPLICEMITTLQQLMNDETQALEWQVHTLRNLAGTSEQNEINTVGEIQDGWAVDKEHIYTRHCNNFVKEVASSLLKPVEVEAEMKREHELLQIFRTCGELTILLWLQDVKVQCWGCSVQDIQEPFRNSSKRFKAHHMLKLDPDETHMDGRIIQMVVEPALLAYPIGKFHEYTGERVWKPAVVWFSQDDMRKQSNLEHNESGGNSDNKLNETLTKIQQTKETDSSQDCVIVTDGPVVKEEAITDAGATNQNNERRQHDEGCGNQSTAHESKQGNGTAATKTP